MKLTHLSFIIFQVFALIISYSISTAQPTGTPCGNRWEAPLSEIVGKVQKISLAVPPGTAKEGLHLDVKTSKKILPSMYFRKNV
ncbi:MAG: hypothetical protein D3923_05425 [Candidatus Electrothrix sp. AR3]|nr:hypothetical protein [Candidatus Electrothrix sp. AR3]